MSNDEFIKELLSLGVHAKAYNKNRFMISGGTDPSGGPISVVQNPFVISKNDDNTFWAGYPHPERAQTNIEKDCATIEEAMEFILDFYRNRKKV